MVRHCYTEEQRCAALADYAAGVPLNQIADRHRISKNYVCVLAHRNGISPPGKRLSAAQRKEIVREHTAGTGRQWIAEHFKVSARYVSYLATAAKRQQRGG